MKCISAIFISLLLPVLALAEDGKKSKPLEVGMPAPALKSVSDAGKPIDLAKAFKSEGYTLVYFYPKADTPGCTAQACSIRDAYATMLEKDITIFGVSMDSVEAQAAFKDKYDLPFTLLADVEGEVVRAFGVPARGRFAARQAFLIHEGKVVWRDLKASTRKQAEDVLKVVAEKEASSAGSPG